MVGMVVFAVKMKRKLNPSGGRKGGWWHVSPPERAGGASE